MSFHPVTASLVVLGAFSFSPARAMEPEQIQISNESSIVYIEVVDDAGNFMESGTGFIVSHDGYVITADHIKVAPGNRIYGTIGQRQGTRFPLDFRAHDEVNDIALWQLPQAPVCRPAVTLSTQPPGIQDTITVLGFPAEDGLSTAVVHMMNLSSPAHGFYKVDGLLQEGNSGGPAFNADGQVVAIVQGGTMPGTEQNDLVPVSLVISLLTTRGVHGGIDAPLDYDSNCYSLCRDAAHGIEGWQATEDWESNSGWLPGGHGQRSECDKLIAGTLAGKPGATIELLPGPKGMWEDSKKDFFGHVEYLYHCRGSLKSGPIYVEARSSHCPLRQ